MNFGKHQNHVLAIQFGENIKVLGLVLTMMISAIANFFLKGWRDLFTVAGPSHMGYCLCVEVIKLTTGLSLYQCELFGTEHFAS